MASWTMLGGPPKLPKETWAVLAGGNVAKRPAFGAPRHSTPDLTFEPQGAIEERARLRAMYGRRADHLIVDGEDTPPRAQQTAPAASRRQPQPPAAAPRRPPGGSRANPSKAQSAQAQRTDPSRGEHAATMKPTAAREELDMVSISGAATMHAASAGTHMGGRFAAKGAGARGGPSAGGTSGAAAAAAAADAAAALRLTSASPVSVHRARMWSAEVEDAFRLQMAGYRDVQELLLLGEPPPERWGDDAGGFIRKLCCRETIGGERRTTYFRKARECQDCDVPNVKLYVYEGAVE